MRHVVDYPDLEEEMTHFSTHGYVGTGSPNRADALFWALAELFPGIVKGAMKARDPKDDEVEAEMMDWMG